MNPNRTILRFPDPEAVCHAAAEEFVRIAAASIADRGRFIFALSGGSTPKRLYELLAQPPYRDEVDWTRIEFFWGDERTVPPEHADSNYRMTREALLQPLGIAPEQIHRMVGESPDLDAAAQEYEAEIAHVFGIPVSDEPPAFDLVLLGLGPDGHTASLFPHTAALQERTRWVVANQVPQQNTWRLTLTVPVLNQASEVLFLVDGSKKASVLAEVLEGPPDADRLPSQLVQPSPGELKWFLDESAAAGLSK